MILKDFCFEKSLIDDSHTVRSRASRVSSSTVTAFKAKSSINIDGPAWRSRDVPGPLWRVAPPPPERVVRFLHVLGQSDFKTCKVAQPKITLSRAQPPERHGRRVTARPRSGVVARRPPLTVGYGTSSGHRARLIGGDGGET